MNQTEKVESISATGRQDNGATGVVISVPALQSRDCVTNFMSLIGIIRALWLSGGSPIESEGDYSMLMKKLGVILTTLPFLWVSTIGPAQARVVDTQTYVASGDRQAQLARIEAVILREDVSKTLSSLGVDPQHATQRVAELSDQELQEMAENIESMPAGGDALAVIGIVFLVLIVLEVTGVINVFKGV